jgi:hypothetical protein
MRLGEKTVRSLHEEDQQFKKRSGFLKRVMKKFMKYISITWRSSYERILKVYDKTDGCFSKLVPCLLARAALWVRIIPDISQK